MSFSIEIKKKRKEEEAQYLLFTSIGILLGKYYKDVIIILSMYDRKERERGFSFFVK